MYWSIEKLVIMNNNRKAEIEKDIDLKYYFYAQILRILFWKCNSIGEIYVLTFLLLHFSVWTESGRLEFEEFVTLAAKFIVEEDDEAMQKELKEAFRLYDKEGTQIFVFIL